MGDEKHYTIQIKGTAYKFRPIPDEDAARVVVVANMGATTTKTIKAVMHVLASSAGAEQWDAITDRLITKEVTVGDIGVKLFKTLLQRQRNDAKKEDGAE